MSCLQHTKCNNPNCTETQHKTRHEKHLHGQNWCFHMYTYCCTNFVHIWITLCFCFIIFFKDFRLINSCKILQLCFVLCSMKHNSNSTKEQIGAFVFNQQPTEPHSARHLLLSCVFRQRERERGVSREEEGERRDADNGPQLRKQLGLAQKPVIFQHNNCSTGNTQPANNRSALTLLPPEETERNDSTGLLIILHHICPCINWSSTTTLKQFKRKKNLCRWKHEWILWSGCFLVQKEVSNQNVGGWRHTSLTLV